MIELLPGLYQIDTTLGGNCLALYLLRGERTLPVGRYADVVAADDLCYDPELMGWLDAMIGSDTPVEIGLRGGETLNIGGYGWEVLHAPGHSAGHLALWEAERRVLIALCLCVFVAMCQYLLFKPTTT